MIFWKRNKGVDPATSHRDAAGQLEQVVRNHMADADDLSVRVVTAVTGLLACVAFADRDFSEAERRHVREVLERVRGLSGKGVDAVEQLLQREVVQLAVGNVQAHTRVLREHTDVEMRREVLDALVDLAAADEAVTFEETQLLRRVTSALGLTQDDYNLAQERYRDRLTSLR